MATETLTVEKNIRLDIGTLDARAAHLPTSMQDNFVWLGRFMDEECSRDLDLLAAAFKEVGIEHDKTTWSKILRGMWKKDSKGNELEVPILSEAKFNRAVELLKNSNRVKEMGGGIPFVMTPTAQLIFDYINIRRAPDRVNKFGVIIGETGTQKTASTKQFVRENNHGLCTRIEAPETPSMSQFMTDLAVSYGYSAQSSYQKKKAYVLEKVNRKKTIIIENIQQLYIEKKGASQPIFDFLKKLQEDTGCTVIVTFTPAFEMKFMEGMHKGFFEQFVGRAGGTRKFLRLAAHPTEDDVEAIAHAFKFKNLDQKTTWPLGKDSVKNVTALEYLCMIAREPGRIRRLFEDLQDAKIEAEADEKPLTIATVKTVRGED
jgi:DNA transposition AAA+ family ATPase